MINRKFISKLLVISCLGVAVLVQSTDADARFKQRNYSHHRHYSKSKFVTVLPGRFVKIAFGGLSYYYVNGIFYQKRDRGYVVVAAPRGAVVSKLPRGRRVIVDNGMRYYTFNGVYWKRTPAGYIVVSNPTTIALGTPQTLSRRMSKDRGKSFVINIPNRDGSYTTVTLIRSGGGFTGPQGEYYHEFPQVDQLKAMYGKQSKEKFCYRN